MAAQEAAAGDGTVYRVIGGTIAGLHAGGYANACTLAPALAAPATTDLRTPAGGEVLFYLVEASNGCGAGGFEAGTGRGALTGVSPGPC